MRLLRGAVPTVLDEHDYRFELGKAAELRVGRDAVMISTGLMTMRALDAAKRLEKDNVDVAVVHVPTIKPLDREAILRAADPDRLVVTLENHTVVGGLAESVASCLAFAGRGRRIVPIALPDRFLDAGACPRCTTATGSRRTRSWPGSKRSSETTPTPPPNPATRARKIPPGPARRHPPSA